MRNQTEAVKRRAAFKRDIMAIDVLLAFMFGALVAILWFG